MNLATLTGIKMALITGTSGNDLLTGTDGTDEIWGYDGDDTLNGGAGNDTLYGGYGEDIVDGGDGNDYVYGGSSGNDTLTGGSGTDTLEGGSGNDTYTFGLGDGSDVILEAYDSSSDRLEKLLFKSGITPNMVKVQSSGSDLVLSIAGSNDSITIKSFNYSGGPSNAWNPIQQVQFSDGTIWTAAQLTAFVLAGTPGADSIMGTSGDDTFAGSAGNDTLDGAGGNDTYTFGIGDGQDLILASYDTSATRLETLSFKAGVTPTVVSGHGVGKDLVLDIAGTTDSIRIQSFMDTAGNPVNTVNPVQQVKFSDGTTWDLSKLLSLALTRTGTAGDDSISGYGGNDSFVGGTGDDTLNGGDGNDTYYFGLGDGKDTILSNYEAIANRNETLIFKEGIRPQDVAARFANNGLQFVIAGTEDSITIQGFSNSSNTYSPIQQVQFSDGTTLNRSQLNALGLKGLPGVTLTGTTANDTLLGGSGYDSLSGLAGNDVIEGGIGDDSIDGGTGNDSLLGGSGNDYIRSGNSQNDNDTLDGGSGNDTLLGSAGADLIFGGSGNDYIEGYSYSSSLDMDMDTMDGGTGNDTLYGGDGNDTYLFGNGDGQDEIKSSYSGNKNSLNTLQFKAGINPSDIRITRDAHSLTLNIVGTTDSAKIEYFFRNEAEMRSEVQQVRFSDGTTWNQALLESKAATNTITGTSGSDTLSGTSNYDYIVGLDGNDALDGYGGDILVGGAGNDTLTSSTDYYSGDGVLYGGAGDDTYSVNDLYSIRVIENVGEGIDTLIATGSIYSLPDNVENGVLVQNSGYYLSGNNLDNVLTGNENGNHVAGLTGNDTLIGGGGEDTYLFSAGDGQDTILPITNTDINHFGTIYFGEGIASSGMRVRIVGTSLELSFSGLPDKITVEGFYTGNSTQSASNPIQQVIFGNENLTWDLDTLMDHVSTEVFGTEGSDTLTGDAKFNDMRGLAGNDTLSGQAGNDTLDGGTGMDSLIGGSGDDLYVVDNAGDTVMELVGEGTDRVDSSVSFTLGANVEQLTLTGTTAINGTGNELANTLTGNSADNILDGGTGVDTLVGGAGNDTYIVDRGMVVSRDMNGNIIHIDYGDIVVEGKSGGTDLVLADSTHNLSLNVENLTLIGTGNHYASGNDLANVMTGNAGANQLWGGAGNDTLNGGAGNDTLGGGEGDDTYVFNLGGGLDTIAADTESRIGRLDTLQFGAGILPGSVTARLVGTALELSINANDKVTINSFYVNNGASNSINPANPLQQVVFTASGDTWDLAKLTSLINGNQVTGTTGNDNLTGTAQVDKISGLAGNDTLTGLAGNDTLDGGVGTDKLIGGAGDDTYIVDDTTDVVTELASEGTDIIHSSVTYTASANVEKLTLTGSAALNATGNALDNILTGNTGDNVLNALAGADTLVAGAGNDTYVVDNAADSVIELASEGTDLVQASVSWTLGNNLENLALTGVSALNATGNALANVLTGNAGANRLTGGAGNDTYVFTRGGGQDTISAEVDASANRLETLTFATGILPTDITARLVGTALELSIAGTSDKVTIESFFVNNTASNTANPIQQVVFAGPGVTWNLATLTTLATTSTITGTTGNDTLTGTAKDDKLLGLAGNDNLSGLAGNDTLDGGAGNDKMSGGAGNDTYLVDVGGDAVTELPGEGTDTIVSSVSYTTSANVENLTLSGSAAINATGNILANVLTGNAAANVLNGQAGADALIGGAGNDVYVVDVAGDVVTELAGEGTDLIQSTLSWTLGTNVENLTLTGRLDINATGNAVANVLTGNGGANVLDGSTGNDTMAGGLGNDTYAVDAAGDVVIETTGQGTDRIVSSVSYTASANVENLTLTGSAALDATGNALANVLTGNSGANVLSGLAGADTLIGGAGDDTYIVDVAGDVVTELTSEGTDLIKSSVTYTASANVENLTLTGAAAVNATGNALNNVLTGNDGINTLDGGAGNDTLSAGAGNDKLVGGVGADVLAGGAGNDLFVFAAGDSVLSVSGTGGAGVLTGFDTITGFSLGWLVGAQDKIDTIGAPAVLANTAGVDGFDSVLTIAGQTIKSHAIVKGMVTFDDAGAYSSALTLGSMSDVAAVVQYLQANDLGNAGATVAFDATTGGIVHTFLFTQGDNAGTNNLDVLIDLLGINANGVTTSTTGVAADVLVIG